MKTKAIGTDTYSIFEKSEKGNLLMLHFLWGKKDFRIFLEPAKTASGDKKTHTVLLKEGSSEIVLTRLQYLYQYEWYEYQKVSGHGLAHDEIQWIKGSALRYLELPQHFYEVAVELACREFKLIRKKKLGQAV